VGSAFHRALEAAYDVLDRDALSVDKTMWGSPAGKKRIAARLVKMLPPHRTYAEPFAGSAAVLFAKEPSEVEAINDADEQIARAYRAVQKLRPRDIERLRSMDWTGDKDTFKSMVNGDEPKDAVGWLHHFLYVTHFSYGKMRGKSFSPSGQGVLAKTVDRIEAYAPRLQHVKIFSGDYKKVVEEFDGKDTVHFLDPPYAGYNVDVGEDRFDEETFCKVLESLDGKFLVTYGIRGDLPRLVKEAGFETRRIRTRRSIRSMRGVGGSSVLTQLLVANYGITQKSFRELADDGWEVEEPTRSTTVTVPEAVQPAPAADDTPMFTKCQRLLKHTDPTDERYVLGIVLEPETVDAQGDVYSAEEVRKAAHLFMEEFGGIGLMHRLRINDQVKVLENFLAPADLELGGTTVKKGTWLLGVRVLDDALWAQVKEGCLTGFSIGGSARRVPEGTSPEPAEPEAA